MNKLIPFLVTVACFNLTAISVHAQIAPTTFIQHIEVFVPCANDGLGEWIIGDFTVLLFSEEQIYHANPVGGVAIGQETGDIYQGTGVTSSIIGKMNNTGTFVLRFQFVSKNVRFLTTNTVHITFNANGDLVAEFSGLEVICR